MTGSPKEEWIRSSRRLYGATLLVAVALLAVGCESEKQTEIGGGPVRVGAAAPDFTLASAQGGTVALASYRGHKPVLLYFSMGPG